MNVCILGPVITDSYYGGVATFNESLAEALHEMGHQAVILTTQKDVSGIYGVYTPSKKMRRSIRRLKPEIIIASLEYGRFLSVADKDITKLYYLHGFFNFNSYGVVRTLLFVFYQKWMLKKADSILANSRFTAVVNRRIWNIHTDEVISPGVSQEFIKKVTEAVKIKNTGSGIILFAGRLVKSKGIDRIITAFHLMKENDDKTNYRLKIVGSGPMEYCLKEQVFSINEKVEFLKQIPQSDMYSQYRKCELFISLNATEPYGIVYVEALLAGCKIICPDMGGQVEFLKEYPDRVAFVDPFDVKSIQSGMERMMNTEITDLDSNKLTEQFSYRKTAEKILNVAGGKGNNV